MKVWTERAVSAPPRVIDSSHRAIEPSVAATLGEEQMLAFGAVLAKRDAPALRIGEHHAVERFETHRPSSAHHSQHTCRLGLTVVGALHTAFGVSVHRRAARAFPRLPIGSYVRAASVADWTCESGCHTEGRAGH